MTNSKYVTDWWLELLPNGVYHLLMNTTERGLQYRNFSQDGDLQGFIVCQDEDTEDLNDIVQEVPLEFLNKRDKITYLEAASHNKDQISFFFIPYKHEWIRRPDKIILQSDKL